MTVRSLVYGAHLAVAFVRRRPFLSESYDNWGVVPHYSLVVTVVSPGECALEDNYGWRALLVCAERHLPASYTAARNCRGFLGLL